MPENRRVRTMNQVVQFFKEHDPETPISYTTIKRAVDDGSIPHVNTGSRKLIVLEDAYEYFFGVPLAN